MAELLHPDSDSQRIFGNSVLSLEKPGGTLSRVLYVCKDKQYGMQSGCLGPHPTKCR